jgi:Tfp pilus assembly protein PilV
MKLKKNKRGRRGQWQAGVTLVEVVMATVIAAASIATILNGHVMSIKRAEWSGLSFAAQSMALQRIEQTRACKWDLSSSPAVDELVPANFPVQIDSLDLPISGTNILFGTNFTTITTISTDPPLKSVRVDCVWYFSAGSRAFTNTVVTYRGPDSN